MDIRERVSQVLAELPPRVELVAAAKTRTPDEVLEAISAGVRIVGENYVREAESAYALIGRKARWHFIGHLQKNKVKRAVEIFDVIETVDSLKLAAEISRRAEAAGKIMTILLEINSGREPQKFGLYPEAAKTTAEQVCRLPGLALSGLMTMGPECLDQEELRPFFRATRQLFEELASGNLPGGAAMRYLSMGMSGSFRAAIEEGANLVRLGTGIFGPRNSPVKE